MLDDFPIQIVFLETLSPAFKVDVSHFRKHIQIFTWKWDDLIAAIYETWKLIANMHNQ